MPFATALLVNVRAEVAGVGGPGAPGAPGAPGGRAGARAAPPSPPAGGDRLGRRPAGPEPGPGPGHGGLRGGPGCARADGPPALMATFGGLVGYPGLNGAGIAHSQNALANGVWRHGLPHYPLKRVLLEQDLLAGCLEVFDRARLASCGNYVLADRTPAPRWTRVPPRTATRCSSSRAGRGGAHQPLPQPPLLPPGSDCWSACPIPPLAANGCRALLRSPSTAGSRWRRSSPLPARPRPGGAGRGDLPPRAVAPDEDHRLDHRRAGRRADCTSPGATPARGSTPPTAWNRASRSGRLQRYRASAGPQGAKATVA